MDPRKGCETMEPDSGRRIMGRANSPMLVVWLALAAACSTSGDLGRESTTRGGPAADASAAGGSNGSGGGAVGTGGSGGSNIGQIQVADSGKQDGNAAGDAACAGTTVE